MNRFQQHWQFREEDLQLVRQSTLVRELEHHEELPSTNTRALSIATDPHLRVPKLVLTDRQTAGRGRGSNPWWSAPGALTFSLILDGPDMQDMGTWPRISLTTGIAVCEALHLLCPGLHAGVKWPNDVFVRMRKVCGILVEVPPPPCGRIVVGVGINVNNSLQQAPPAIRSVANSLLDVAGYPFQLTTVLITILQQLAVHLDLLTEHPDRLLQRWQDFCILAGRNVQIEVGSRRIAGICQGIDAGGALLVETPVGLERCSSGVVTLID